AGRDFSIVSDLRRPHSGVAHEPGIVEAFVLAGYRSVLSVRAVAQQQVMLLGFFSKHTNTYTMDDVPAARHIADYVAVAVAHEQLAAAERDRAEARGRSDRVATRVRALAENGATVAVHGRIVGRTETWRLVLMRALRVAPTEATVFLQGESGTGKEVVARFI